MILCLNQHLQGKHGNGAITLCGIKYQWPDSKYRHQVDCDDCKKLKEKQNEKPEYPHKIIIRMRKPRKLVVKVQTSQLHGICCDQLIFSKQQIMSCKYVFDFFGRLFVCILSVFQMVHSISYICKMSI